jgi:hypothetical protein
MELTIENIIKIILGLLVVVVVSYAIYYFFSNNVIDLFRNVGVNSTAKFSMALIH